MKKIIALLLMPMCVFAGPVFDKTTKTWTFESDNPEDIRNVIKNERAVDKKVAMLNAARLAVLNRTNILTQIVTPYTPTLAQGPRIYSKMKCVIALSEIGVWPQVKAWIEENGLYDVYLAAQDFREDNPYFKRGIETLKGQLGLTDAQIEALLKKCIAD